MSFEIAAECVGRLVAAGAIFFERPPDDPVQLAAHHASELIGLRAPIRGDGGQRVRRAFPSLAQRRRILFANRVQDALELHGGAIRGRVEPIDRCGACEEFVENYAERVDVAAGVDIGGAEIGLLGTHVTQRADQHPDLREGGLLSEFRTGCLGQTEIDDSRYRHPLLQFDQNVRGLDVAVNDALLMGVLDGLADGNEERETFGHGEPVGIAVAGDRQPIHEPHHEVWGAGRGGAGFENARDVGMIHHREGLSLAFETSDHQPGIHAGLDHF